MIGKISPSDERDPLAGFEGLIYRFTRIDMSKPWFNLDQGTEADQATVSREVRIPAHLCPNLATFHYRFFPVGHRLVFETKNEAGDTISPRYVETLLATLAAQPEIATSFQNVDVTVEQDQEQIAQIVEAHALSHLEIMVKRPNPDDNSDADEREIFGEMQSEGVRKKTVSLTAISHGAITPNEKTKRMARVASSNGKVNATAKTSDGKKQKLSSEAHPKIVQEKYNPAQQTRGDVFLEAARRLRDFLLPSNRG